MLVGDGAHRVQLEQEVRSQGLDNIIFTGRLDKSQVRLIWLALMHCLVHLRKQGCSRPFCHQRCSRHGDGQANLLGVEMRRGLSAPRHAGIAFGAGRPPAALVARSRLSRTTPRRLANSAADGRRYVLRHFDRDDLARDYLDVLHRTCESPEEFEVPICA